MLKMFKLNVLALNTFKLSLFNYINVFLSKCGPQRGKLSWVFLCLTSQAASQFIYTNAYFYEHKKNKQSNTHYLKNIIFFSHWEVFFLF